MSVVFPWGDHETNAYDLFTIPQDHTIRIIQNNANILSTVFALISVCIDAEKIFVTFATIPNKTRKFSSELICNQVFIENDVTDCMFLHPCPRMITDTSVQTSSLHTKMTLFLR
jgi:hypothetical protein